MPMGITSENVATKYGISRKQQDEFALNSHLKQTRLQNWVILQKKSFLFKQRMKTTNTFQ